MGAIAYNALLSVIFFMAMIRTVVPQPEKVLSQKFQDNFKVSWAPDHVRVLDGGALVELVLDKASGSGLQSTSEYTYGYFSVSMQLVANNSAGTVTSFYLFSTGDHHDEVDYEFLGNSTGEPYTLQTNVFANGVGEREERISLWFDPTTAFHAYTFLWNHAQIVMLVDDIPIRVFRNLKSLNSSMDYPSWRPMGLYSSLFDASSWATRGGMVKIDYSAAPFVGSYSAFKVDACRNDGNSTININSTMPSTCNQTCADGSTPMKPDCNPGCPDGAMWFEEDCHPTCPDGSMRFWPECSVTCRDGTRPVDCNPFCADGTLPTPHCRIICYDGSMPTTHCDPNCDNDAAPTTNCSAPACADGSMPTNCEQTNQTTSCATDWQNNWWEGAAFTTLNATQKSQMLDVRNTHMIYGYCTDRQRNPVVPFECPYNNLELD